MACLKKFANVQTVSRDGSGTYKKAFNEALPEAAQISDRFHLVKNSVEAIERVLTNIIPFCIRPVLKPLGGWYFTGKGIQYYQIFYVKGVTKGELGDI